MPLSCLRNHRLLILSFCCFALAPLHPALAASGEDIIARVQAKHRSLKNLTLHFSMVTATESQETSVREEQEGRIYLGGKGRYRLESRDQTLVCDGKTLWSFHSGENQVILYRADAEDTPFLAPDQLLFEFPAKYRVVGVSESRLGDVPCFVLSLLPREAADPTKSLEVWVDREQYLTRRVRLEDLAGNVTVFEFEDFQTGQKLPDRTFRFDPPEGAEVIDLR
jgi:outer membrane lipoprotein-sorting protein